jgi:hypothetical protein
MSKPAALGEDAGHQPSADTDMGLSVNDATMFITGTDDAVHNAGSPAGGSVLPTSGSTRLRNSLDPTKRRKAREPIHLTSGSFLEQQLHSLRDVPRRFSKEKSISSSGSHSTVPGQNRASLESNWDVIGEDNCMSAMHSGDSNEIEILSSEASGAGSREEINV